MKFQITASAFVNGEYIAADVRNPAIREFAADTELDNIGPRWVPLDDEAKQALVRLDAQARERQAAGGVEKPVGKSGKVAPIAAPAAAPLQEGHKTPETMSEATRSVQKK